VIEHEAQSKGTQSEAAPARKTQARAGLFRFSMAQFLVALILLLVSRFSVKTPGARGKAPPRFGPETLVVLALEEICLTPFSHLPAN
jgi:hypothetical protein